MKINKDLVFAISVILWLWSNILSYIFYKSDGVSISNFVFIILFGIMLIAKFKIEKFNSWLENKI